MKLALSAASAAISCVFTLLAPVAAQGPARDSDVPLRFNTSRSGYDYEKRVVMVPMRDKVKLYTVILIPKGAEHAPILLTRTPYNAAGRATRSESKSMLEELPQGDDVFVGAGYIRVFQDVRGKYGSEGDYLMTPPPVGPFNRTGTDDITDAYDTIDWLVKNLPESNGKVGMIGASYEGFTVAMALLHPHPALKVAAPESPMIDAWMGDDVFHYGAFRYTNVDYFASQTEARGSGNRILRDDRDEYTNLLAGGSAGDWARAAGLEQLPYWHKVLEHPAYDQFWQSQALDRLLAAAPLTVPTMWVQGLWDQEDMWGAIHSYQAVEPKDTANQKNFLVMGPWRHSGMNYDGASLGPLAFNGDTALQFRRDVLLPFFNQYLMDGAPRAETPPVLIYNTGENHWDRFTTWPQSCEHGCPHTSRPLFLTAGGHLSFQPSAPQSAENDEYLSDPAKPVPYRPRPVSLADGDAWKRWLIEDQRFVDGRPDVLTYMSDPLTEPVHVSGVPQVNLFASTTGTDSDWIVKLIDVYPGNVPSQSAMGGYELPISLDIFRGRYRKSFEHPEAIASNTPLLFTFGLPSVNHVFLPRHRIMVQIQSTLFPLYDRNPQTFIPNIFFAAPADYQKATQRIWHSSGFASRIDLPVAP